MAQNKVYDGNTNAVITGAILQGVVGADDVQLDPASVVGTFASANAGDNISVTAALTLQGTAIGNYTLIQPVGLTANITPKALTVSGAAAQNKVYDGNTNAVIVGATLDEDGVVIVGGERDEVQLDPASGVGAFASANVGDGIAVTAALTLQGVAKGNYTLVQPVGLSANITPKWLTVSGAAAQNKVYDGNTNAVIVGVLQGVVSGDDVQLDPASGVGTFADANVGTHAVTPATLTLRGAAKGNYTLIQPAGLSADITPMALTIGGSFTVYNKIYDGTTPAEIVLPHALTLEGVVGGDEGKVTLINVQATFSDATVGTGKTVRITSAELGGAAATNYTLSLYGAPTTAADITAIPDDLSFGSLQVNIEPEGARAGGARWRLTTGPDTGWKESGTTIENIPPGTYAVAFEGVRHYVTPAQVTVAIVADELTIEGATYSLYGDVDGNGDIMVNDAIMVLRYIVRLTVLSDEELVRANVTSGDLKPTVSDAILILRYIVGLIDEFPAGLEAQD